jgi:hypothetical protein
LLLILILLVYTGTLPKQRDGLQTCPELQLDQDDSLLLTTAVRANCPPENANHSNLFIINYINLNAFAANFYAEKDSYTTGYRCYYDVAANDVHTASDRLNVEAPPYAITVALDRQPPPDSENVWTKDLTLFLASDPRYSLMTELKDYLQIYRKVK